MSYVGGGYLTDKELMELDVALVEIFGFSLGLEFLSGLDYRMLFNAYRRYVLGIY